MIHLQYLVSHLCVSLCYLCIHPPMCLTPCRGTDPATARPRCPCQAARRHPRAGQREAAARASARVPRDLGGLAPPDQGGPLAGAGTCTLTGANSWCQARSIPCPGSCWRSLTALRLCPPAAHRCRHRSLLVSTRWSPWTCAALVAATHPRQG